MKKLLVSSLLGLALIALSGCTNSSDAKADTSAKKCAASGKCSGDMAKKAVSKCAAGGKCAGDMAKKAAGNVADKAANKAVDKVAKKI